jgi:hypothetical protein
MTRNRLSLVVLAAFAALPSIAAHAQLQGQQPGPEWDGVKAAPANHKVIFENDRVRVLKVTIQPGETEKPHTHALPSVMHVEDNQPLLEIFYAEDGGKLKEVARKPIPTGKPPEAMWFKPEGLHALINLGTAPYTAVRVELKPQPATPPSP